MNEETAPTAANGLSAAASRLAAALEGRYAVERELGRGGMATVYLARDVRHDRLVAVKVLSEELASTLGADRFVREIWIAAQLTHPHILPLYDSGEADGQVFYVMPFVAGQSLREKLNREKQLSLEDSMRIASEVADALDYAHEKGIVHRDIKPENILISGRHALVADFGIARAISVAAMSPLTQTGLSIGTPTYMSPEQAGGESAVDGRSDIYSLGCVLYEMLVGLPPFVGVTPQAIIAQRFLTPPPLVRASRSTVPPGVEQVIAKALAITPADRFATASEFARALASGEVRPPSRARRKIVLGAGLLLLVAGAGIAIFVVLGRAPTGVVADPQEQVGAVATLPRNAIAVLPFVSFRPDSTTAYIGDGIAEELIIALGKLPGLMVAGRASSFAAHARDLTLQQMGQLLRVGTVVRGTVRQQGSRLRLTVTLENVADGYQIWEESYEREFVDLFAMQEEVSRAIARRLQSELARPDLLGNYANDSPLVRHTTSSVKAYDHYLRGRFFWNKRTAEGFRLAIEEFEQALKIDSRFAAAYAGLADSYLLLGSATYGYRQPASMFPRAKEAAERAVKLDSTLAAPHASLAFVRMNADWDWKGADAEFRSAFRQDPRYATAHHWYGVYLNALGRMDEARASMSTAHDLEPLSLIINSDYARVMYHARDYKAAVEQYRSTLEMDATFPGARIGLARSLLASGDVRSAIAGLELVEEFRAGYAVGVLGAAYARADRRPEAQAIADQLVLRSGQEFVSPIYVAYVYAALGDRDQAFSWLERAFKQRSNGLLHIKVDPLLDPLRDDLRFAKLVERMRLP
ncbi:MAG: protein kinase [Anaerolineae bacterium]|nr:protein kinase [Gemmatimonadaceae bacterium]